MSFRWMTPSSRPSLATASGVPPACAIRSAIAARARHPSWRRRHVAAHRRRCRLPRHRRAPHRPRPCGSTIPSISTPLIGSGPRRGRSARSSGAMSRPRRPYFSLASTTIERPSGVSSASEASWAASASSLLGDAGERQELGRLPVAEGDGAGLVEQQRVDVARRLDRAARHRQHVERTSRSMPAMPMADSSAPIVVGIRQTSSATRTAHRDGAAGIGGEARDGARRRRGR